MEHTNTQQNIEQNQDGKSHVRMRDAVLKKIDAGEISMRPRIYFTLKLIVLAFISILAVITAALLFSFIAFSLRVSGTLLLLGFGWRGMGVFIRLFPWTLLFIGVCLFAIIEWLFRKFEFGYRRPILYIIIVLAVLVSALGLIINETPLHQSLLYGSEHHQPVPFLGGFYTGLRRPPREQGICRGDIVSLQSDGFTMECNGPHIISATITRADGSSTIVVVSTSTNGIVSSSMTIASGSVIASSSRSIPLTGSSTATLTAAGISQSGAQGVAASAGHTDDLDDNASTTPVRVVLPPGTSPDGTYKVGDEVFVAGDLTGDTIHAFGIAKFADDDSTSE